MKIRGRLISAFTIMTVVPLLITTLCVKLIVNKQTTALARSYNIDTKNYSDLDFILNPVNYFSNITLNDFQEITKHTVDNPDLLYDTDYLDKINTSLKKKGSYMLAVRAGSYYYVGDKKKFKKIVALPKEIHYRTTNKQLVYFDLETSSIIKKTTFSFSDRSIGYIYLICDYTSLYPHWKQSLYEILFAFLLIILTTGIILTMWLYQSIVCPLNLLRAATTQIGNGTLDQPITIQSYDEIGQLCKDFEEMRTRLQTMVQNGIKAEENTRQIMSSISHDLKTPITAIKGYTEGILDGVADTEDKQKKYLQTIYSKANDMTYLIDELSIFSKVARNTLAYNFISISADAYFRDCIEDFSLDLESENISISYENLCQPNTQILVDAEQLKRVLHNIIGNAVKYNNKDQGHISISIEDIPVVPVPPPLYRQINDDGTYVTPIPEPEEFIQVEISDNGPGIAAKDLPYIFDRFYRADASRNSSKRGSGLGLAIVKMIVADHGGKVWVKSQEGKGSSFYFTLKKDTQDNEGRSLHE